MPEITYQERMNAERTEKVRRMLRDLPPSCTDFINSITMTTSPLTRMAIYRRFVITQQRNCPIFRQNRPPPGMTMTCPVSLPAT